VVSLLKKLLTILYLVVAKSSIHLKIHHVILKKIISNIIPFGFWNFKFFFRILEDINKYKKIIYTI